LITHDPNTPLVIQGGPGTGKTAVGLHRASWLLYTARDNLHHRGVLVIGPNRTFMEYVSHVLPALGEDSVEQRAVGELVDGVVPELRDPPAVAELKADVRLAEVVRRAAELRLASEPEELVIRLEGSFISVPLPRYMNCSPPPARPERPRLARERFRMSLLRASTRSTAGCSAAARFETSTRSSRRCARRATSTASSRPRGRSSRPTVSSIRCSRIGRRSRRRPTASSTRTSSGCSSGVARHGRTATSHSSTRHAPCSMGCRARTGT